MPRYISGAQDLYESGLDNLIEAVLNRHAVIAGSGGGAACQVIAHAVPDMGVRVGAGTIQGDAAALPVRVAVAQTDLTIAANGSANTRVDLVSVNFTTGVPTRTTGTADGTNRPPALPATDILLGYVSVPPAAANVQNANISDRRLFLPGFEDVNALRAVAGHTTRTIFIGAAACQGFGGGAVAALGPHPVITFPDASATGGALGELILPADFVALLSVKAMIQATTSANMYLTTRLSYAYKSDGTQNYQNRSDSVAAGVVAVTANVVNAVDVTAMADGLTAAAGDVIGLQVVRDGTQGTDTVNSDVYFFGYLVTYTSDN